MKKGDVDEKCFTAVQCIAAHLVHYETLRRYFRNLCVGIFFMSHRNSGHYYPLTCEGQESWTFCNVWDSPKPWRVVLHLAYISNSPLDIHVSEKPIDN